MQIVIYSTTTCPYCKMLTDYLDEKKISYTEKLLDQDDNAKEEMSKISGGFLGVPFMAITKDDGNIQTVVGFDRNRINEVLGII